jgi:hypothetical protein
VGEGEGFAFGALYERHSRARNWRSSRSSTSVTLRGDGRAPEGAARDREGAPATRTGEAAQKPRASGDGGRLTGSE